MFLKILNFKISQFLNDDKTVIFIKKLLYIINDTNFIDDNDRLKNWCHS